MSTPALVGANGQKIGAIDLRNNTITMRDATTGQLVKMDLTPSDVHVPAALPMYAAGYKLLDSYADQAAPPVVVPKASDKYFTWDKDNAFQRVDKLTAGPGGEIPEVSTKLSNTQFTTQEYVLGSFVPTEVEANADAPLKPKTKAMKRIMDAMRLAREDRVMTLMTTTGNWDSTVRVSCSAGQKWNGGATSDPIANIDAIQEFSLQKVTGMLMNRRVWNAFRRNSAVQKFIQFKPDMAGLPTPEAIGKGNGLLTLPPNIYISDMKGKTTSGTYDYVWPDDVVLLSEVDGLPADQESIATAKTFRWSGGMGVNPDKVTPTNDGGQLYQGWLVREFYDPKRGGRGGSMIVCVVSDVEVLTGNIIGGIISGCIQ